MARAVKLKHSIVPCRMYASNSCLPISTGKLADYILVRNCGEMIVLLN